MAKSLEIISNDKLPDPIQLAKETWVIYKARFWTVVGVGFLGYVGIVLLLLILIALGAIMFFVLGGKFQPSLIALGVIIVLVTIIGLIIMGTWISGSIIIAIRGWEKKK